MLMNRTSNGEVRPGTMPCTQPLMQWVLASARVAPVDSSQGMLLLSLKKAGNPSPPLTSSSPLRANSFGMLS